MFSRLQETGNGSNSIEETCRQESLNYIMADSWTLSTLSSIYKLAASLLPQGHNIQSRAPRKRNMASEIIDKPSATAVSVFDYGKLYADTITVKQGDESSPPKDILVVCPKVAGIYTVVLFIQGYLLSNTYYTQLLQHVASHGFILVAPQVYIYIQPSNSHDRCCKFLDRICTSMRSFFFFLKKIYIETEIVGLL